ncbi:MAG: 4-alpha-glucanotransferase [Acidobacteriaceae bacterium]
MLTERASGVLLHVSSLPSRGGIGDLGSAAYAFADFLAAARQQYWQVLPLGPTGYGNSPYSALSAFAGNPLFISLEILAGQGWLDPTGLDALPGSAGPADFERAVQTKVPLLHQAAERFAARAQGELRTRFEQFCAENALWLEAYASFSVLRTMYQGASWSAWPKEYLLREPAPMERFRAEHAQARTEQMVIQFFFDEQWKALRHYCAERKVRFIGDAAIFVNYDSSDVWMYPEIFDLDDQKKSLQVSGVPPDYFSPTGQKWGNPLYKWDVLAERKFDWWEARIRRALALCDLLRLDHFRGFEAYWSVPAEDDNAIRGAWVKAPGMQLFQHLRTQLGDLPLIAEDLGLITPEVEMLRVNSGLPGMRVMQFGFSDRGAHIHLPHRCEENMVIYTGTHDNDTTLGWWHGTNEVERRAIAAYLHPGDDGIVWAMVRAAATSVARLCLFPMQDLLQLGSEARMNTPAQSAGNWAWRYRPDALQPWIGEKLAALTEATDRDGWSEPSSNPG